MWMKALKKIQDEELISPVKESDSSYMCTKYWKHHYFQFTLAEVFSVHNVKTWTALTLVISLWWQNSA